MRTRIQWPSWRAVFHATPTNDGQNEPPISTFQCLGRPGPRNTRRAHQYEEAVEAMSNTGWTLRCAEAGLLSMRIGQVDTPGTCRCCEEGELSIFQSPSRTPFHNNSPRMSFSRPGHVARKGSVATNCNPSKRPHPQRRRQQQS